MVLSKIYCLLLGGILRIDILATAALSTLSFEFHPLVTSPKPLQTLTTTTTTTTTRTTSNPSCLVYQQPPFQADVFLRRTIERFILNTQKIRDGLVSAIYPCLDRLSPLMASFSALLSSQQADRLAETSHALALACRQAWEATTSTFGTFIPSDLGQMQQTFAEGVEEAQRLAETTTPFLNDASCRLRGLLFRMTASALATLPQYPSRALDNTAVAAEKALAVVFRNDSTANGSTTARSDLSFLGRLIHAYVMSNLPEWVQNLFSLLKTTLDIVLWIADLMSMYPRWSVWLLMTALLVFGAIWLASGVAAVWRVIKCGFWVLRKLVELVWRIARGVWWVVRQMKRFFW